MYLAVETHCHIVQNMSVAAENEEALIEWLIINTCTDECNFNHVAIDVNKSDVRVAII